MKEEKNHIDKLFQDKLGERSFEIPTAFLADMEAKLDGGNTWKRGGWITFLSTVFFTAVLAGAYLVTTSDIFQPKSQITAINSEIHSNEKDLNDNQTNSSFNEKKSNGNAGEQLNENSDNISNSTFDSKSIDDQDEINSKSNNGQPKSYTSYNNSDKIAGSKTSSSSQVSGRNSKPTSSSLAKKVDKKKFTNNVSSIRENNTTKKQESTGVTELFPTKTKSQETTKTGGVQELFPSKSDKISTVSKSNSGGVQELFPSKNKDTSLSSNGSRGNGSSTFDDTLRKPKRNIRDSIVIRDSVVIRDSLVIRDSVVLKYQKDPNRNLKFEAQAYAGFMSVQPKIVSPFDSYKTALESGEKKIFSPDFGFHLNAYYKNWTMGTGLKYYQFGEKTNYSTLKISTSINSITISIDSTFLDSNGQIWNPNSGMPPFDTIVSTQIDTTFKMDTTGSSKSWQNSYSRFVIPLNFGYRFDYKDWSFIPRLGVNLEFTTTRQKGLYLNALKEEIIELDQRRFGLSYQVQLEIRRNISNWHVFVNPYYRNNFGYLIDTPDLKRKYGGFGTTFGVGINL